MSRIKSKNTSIEQILAKAMWSEGMRYRKQCKNVFGRPDFCFKSKKIAIFCDSEFWHGKQYLETGYIPKTNTDFWLNKIRSNIQRDKAVNETLINEGWTVIRFWSEDLKKNLPECVERIKRHLT